MTDERVLIVGNCDTDHRAMRSLIERRFDARVDRADTASVAIEMAQQLRYDLILVNRKLFADGSDGVALIGQLGRAGLAQGAPVMMISNFPEAHEAAEAAGGVRGFGKASLQAPETLGRLQSYLQQREDAVAD